MNEGLVAAIILDNQVKKKIVLEDAVDDPDYPYYLSPDIALVMATETQGCLTKRYVA